MTNLNELERLRGVYDRATKCTSLVGAARLSLILDARSMYETALLAAADELIRDARRYRWLRDVRDYAVFCESPGDLYLKLPAQLDAAIDAAIAKEAS